MKEKKKKGAKKNFVLDTNVILHDYKCLENFQENDIFLPIVVLEELDKFKRGSEQINYNAREFVRELDLLTSNDLFVKGAPLGQGLGTLRVVTGSEYPQEIALSFPEKTADHRIIACAWTVSRQHPDMTTIFVTKDVNLRMKARSLGIEVEDYINDKVVDVDLFEREHPTYEDIDPDVIDQLYASTDGVDPEQIDNIKTIIQPNDCFILKSVRASVLARYNPFTGKVHRVEKSNNYGIQPRNAEQTFAFEVLNDPEIKLVGLTGKAGTGKTLLALAAALKQAGAYQQILLARPIVALANKDIGFLPGDEKQKVAPYMQPLFDNLNVIKSHLPQGGTDARKIDDLQKNNQLVIEALAFIRGRSLSETFCIIDEAQNLTPHEVKTIITRAGEGTKMVFTGDIQQIDSPYLDAQSNGLAYMIDKMKGNNLFAHVNLLKGERSALAELASNIL
ncbi:PhoH-like ATPase [Parabacteroides sp. PF5-5]|uniref:PhoH family protein n=1 Tax=unclassified Parabacteroides TaxID=2649774 RepID=UPI0024754B9B|nr:MULTISPECIES: PhoH family protein [unclassified Parabacteroides]MDH6303790.1 PhoH-like ATPase [Parabacteroides sp. PH5-39]MDH6314407.1 PhoH-like ATPase [Parabacteroides sp. PF5-13]MDH6318528.1 PhoH-like ATPase [Parabacteroides sp. PH5-13]MDH6322179.1 PhoH-like ATPase [Parabacteroides sp. PH5-8]MDH6325741.1 PhoH-like ATPase [Parabacteroides sp. PH5-41]